MAAPDNTNEGRTKTGYWTSAAKACASLTLCNSRQGGWSTPKSSNKDENL